MNKKRIKHVYFLYDKKKSLIKIGLSTNPFKRAEYLKSQSNGGEIMYIFWGGGRQKEKEFHIKFEKYRYHPKVMREWFKYSNEIKAFISFLKRNKLVWIGQDVTEIPKHTMYIGFKTDTKTYNEIKRLGVESGRSVHEMTNHIIKRIAMGDRLY